MSHAFGEPPTTIRQPLRVELYFLAHNEAGEPLAHQRALSVALAGTILADLLAPVEHISVADGLVFVRSRELTGDPVADWALRLLQAHRQRRAARNSDGLPTLAALPMREALRQLAVAAHERTTAGLVAGDLVREVSRRRLIGTKAVTFPPTDEMVIPRVRGRLRSVLTGFTQPDWQTDALGGMVRALDLVSELYLDEAGLDIWGLLAETVRRIGETYPAVREVIDTTEALIAETAVSVYG
ncbi:GPP34 family phosphoprotein [Dactylosporangium sp. NBC_01737]|uniref:GOLPH3/VPS74 family protein n=1 Tax=Dactylosporangium sp. NBC_01737 TaxID=2975959 RepID=UPI002E14680B|nr:GPP34 family phosphoprotein [Dactylosporangium sp. NBC_01737]